jgi:hypothetical protein
MRWALQAIGVAMRQTGSAVKHISVNEQGTPIMVQHNLIAVDLA